jgi:beta-glucosidase
VVVVNSGSAITMPWANSVKGIIENWYPGQTDGTAIAALLYGDVNFSGKLPVTFPQSLADVPASTPAQWPGQNGTVQYSEGLDVGYRWYDAQNKTPLFPFGYGLSYTSFGYSNLSVGAPDSSGNVAVGFDVTNTAAVIAAGRTPRRGIADLMIAAIAIAEDLPLYTTNPDDFTGLEHLLTIVPVTRPHLPQHR